MNNMFQVKPNVCGLRRKKNVIQPKFKTIKYGKCSFKYIGSHIWNLLPENLQNAENIKCFKRYIREWEGPTCKCNICCLF